MEKEFWIESWDKRQIGFHSPAANAFLTEYLPKFDLKRGARICLPLCGKTLDIHWLLAQEYKVVGIELVETAIKELFVELGMKPTLAKRGSLKFYQAENIDIYVGDLFELTRAELGEVDFVYDRAAIVALPEDMRQRYTAHILEITQSAPQLLLTFDYDQAEMPGPPHFLSGTEINDHYAAVFQIDELARRDVEGKLKGLVPAEEIARHLYV